MHNIIYVKDACGRPQPTIEYSFLPLLRVLLAGNSVMDPHLIRIL
jgi:hypothetical protein